MELKKMVTESRNKKSENIDTLETLEILKVINSEDALVPLAIKEVLPELTKAVDKISAAFLEGGRLIYMGAGTSGRIGILDASECPPTYGTDPSMVVGLIAGGKTAILHAVENAEDSKEFGVEDLKGVNITAKDVIVGIAASGRTPYVVGGLEYANSCGATTVAVSCNPDSPIAKEASIAISPIVGPEVVTGSSRMKAGTAQKLVLNMLSTASMIKIGKVYGNLMVDVEATNSKLVQRQKNIVIEATGCTVEEAEKALSNSDNNCKLAIFIILSGLEPKIAKETLEKHQGFLRKALAEAK